MRNYWHCFLCITILTAYSQMSYGQDATPNESPYKIPDPLILLNSTVIGNGFYTRIASKDIKEIIVYKEQTAPSLLRNLASTGIIIINYDKPVVSKSFAELARQHGVKGPFRVVLNEHTLDATQAATLRIVPEAIGQVKVTPATAETAEAVLTIQLAEHKTDSRKYPPGTIMIR